MIARVFRPHYGSEFVGRDTEINELKIRIRKYGIVVVSGERGIGKTNLVKVALKDFEKDKRSCHEVGASPSVFYEEMSRIFGLHKSKKTAGISFSLPFTPLTGTPSFSLQSSSESSLLQSMEKSGEKIIFIEDANELNKESVSLILEASRRNTSLRFVLEIASPYVDKTALKTGSYERYTVGVLSDQSIARLAKQYSLPDEIVRRIIVLSAGYPYIATCLIHVCLNRNNEKEMISSLAALPHDDLIHRIDKLHSEVVNTLSKDAQIIAYRLAIAPKILTLSLIEAFSKEKGKLITSAGSIDAQLSELRSKGILKDTGQKEGELFEIYHPLFREYLRNIQMVALENKSELYHEVMKEVNTKPDSIYLLLENLNEEDAYSRLIAEADNYYALNLVGAWCFSWGKIQQAFHAWNRLLDKAMKEKNQDWQIVADGDIGVIFAAKGELDKALDYFERALKEAEQTGTREGIAINLANMATVHNIRGDFDLTLEYASRALKINKELGNKTGISQNLTTMGIAYGIKGDLARSLEYNLQALELNEEIGNQQGIATNNTNIGIIHKTRGDFDLSLEYLTRSLKVNEKLGIKQGIADDLGNLGAVYRARGDVDKALDYFTKSMKLNEEMGNKEMIAANLRDTGDMYAMKGEFDKTMESLTRSMELFEQIGSKYGTMRVLGSIGLAYSWKGDTEAALEYLMKALEASEKLGVKEEFATNLMNIGANHLRRKDTVKALDCFKRALDIETELGRKADIAYVLANIGNVHFEIGKFEEALEYYEKALRIFRSVGNRIGSETTLRNISNVKLARKKRLAK